MFFTVNDEGCAATAMQGLLRHTLICVCGRWPQEDCRLGGAGG